MMTYLVIGICIFLLLAVIYISAKPISMGIEARRNIKDEDDNNGEGSQNLEYNYDEVKNTQNSISREIEKLSDLRDRGLLTQEEYEKAKDKILN